MKLKNEKIISVLVYLEGTKKRTFVGKLYKKNSFFIFEYDKKYFNSPSALQFGPEFPLSKKKYKSKTLFIPFSDRIPSIDNPAYPEYCQWEGIEVNEKDPLVLLSTIASRGPSSFIFAPEYSSQISYLDVKKFQNNLGLTPSEFSTVFEFHKGKITNKDLLKRAAIYIRFPQVALNQIKRQGHHLHTNKQAYAVKYLQSVSNEPCKI